MPVERGGLDFSDGVCRERGIILARSPLGETCGCDAAEVAGPSGPPDACAAPPLRGRVVSGRWCPPRSREDALSRARPASVVELFLSTTGVAVHPAAPKQIRVIEPAEAAAYWRDRVATEGAAIVAARA